MKSFRDFITEGKYDYHDSAASEDAWSKYSDARDKEEMFDLLNDLVKTQRINFLEDIFEPPVDAPDDIFDAEEAWGWLWKNKKASYQKGMTKALKDADSIDTKEIIKGFAKFKRMHK